MLTARGIKHQVYPLPTLLVQTTHSLTNAWVLEIQFSKRLLGLNLRALHPHIQHKGAP